jgi:UDP-N-acetylglucosamine--dolichyl-phosphate N-acetylglucosaminephosphotransferase
MPSPETVDKPSMAVGKPPPPRPLSPLIPAILLPIATTLIVHAQLFSTTTPPYMNVPLLPQHVQNQLVVLLPPTAFPALEASLGFSLVAFVMALYMIPAMGPSFIDKGLKGRDMLKGVAGGVM